MSGIAGLITRDDSGDEEIAGILANQQYRGQGLKQVHSPKPYVHLSFTGRTLASTSVHQPLVDPDSRCVLVGDIRLDNRCDLLGSLGGDKNADHNCSDEALVLQSYLRWGQKCVGRLLGDFAFAIWDPENAWLFIARDHFGVRQLTYATGGQKFIFATDVSGVLAGLNRTPFISRRRLIDFHIDELEGATSTGTFYEGVYRLPAAHCLTVDRQLRVRVSRYWEMQPPAILKLSSDSEYLEAFEGLFSQAIECRTQGVERYGAMLSGGLDSSSIVGYLCSRGDSTGDSVPIYSGAVRGDTLGDDDTYFIKLIADYLSINPSYLYPNSGGANLEALLDEPDSLFDSFLVMPQMIYSAANSDGVSVVLDGLFGDEILETDSKNYWHKFVADRSNSLLDIVSAYGNTTAFYGGGRAQLGSTIRTLLMRYVPTVLRKQLALGKMALSQDEELRLLALDLSFSEKIALAKKRKTVMTIGDGSLRSNQAAFFNHPFTQVALERYDRVAARNNVECRHPLLDKRLVEFCLSLPDDQRLRDGHSRWILRKYMEKVLPKEVAWRAKGQHLGPRFGLADKKPSIASHWKKSPPSLYVKKRYNDLIVPSGSNSAQNPERDLAKRKVMIVSRWLDNQDSEINTETIK